MINADNFQDLDGQTAGGITLSVPMGGNGNDTGILVFQGKPIQEFAIGGQELWIDRICLLTGDPNEGEPMVDCVEFEELNLADVYGVGDVFSVANSDGSLKFDAKVGGFGISGAGSATVENGGKAGAMGQELRVDLSLIHI